MSDVRPSAMTRYLEETDQAINALSKAARRIKIENNHTWNMRLLPVEMGPDKVPFVKLAQHWRNQRPLTCPRHTPAPWGGDPEFNCPVCELSDRLNDSGSDDIRNLAYSARCVLRFRFWCVVFDKEDHRGRIEEMPIEEILNPYEFDMYKTTYEDFKKYQKWSMNRRRGNVEPSEWGIMDLESGCNLLATHGAKGVRLDRSDPGPIFELNDPNFDIYLKKIWARLRTPAIKVATEKELLEMALKFEEDAEKGGGRRSRSRDSRDSRDTRDEGRYSRRSEGEDDDDGGRGDRSDRGGGGGGGGGERAAGGARARYRGEEDDADAPRNRRAAREDDDGAGGDEPSARRRTEESREPAAAPPTRRSTQSSVTAEDMAEDQIPGAEVPAQSQQQQPSAPGHRRGSNPEIPPPVRRTPPAAESQPSAPPPPPTRRQAPPTPPAGEAEGEASSSPPPARRGQPAQSTGGVDDNEDNVPEEARDPAPPVKDRVEDAPPPVSANAPRPDRALSDVKNRLERLTRRGQ